MTTTTYYDILEVAETASQETIKGAYKYLSQKWHPDKNSDNRDDAVLISQGLNEAYAVLSDPLRRNKYDEQMRIDLQRPAVVVDHHDTGFLRRCWLMLVFTACLVGMSASYQLTIVGFNWRYVGAIVFCLVVGWYAYIALFPPRMVIDQPHRTTRPAPTPIETGNARLACVAGVISWPISFGILVLRFGLTETVAGALSIYVALGVSCVGVVHQGAIDV